MHPQISWFCSQAREIPIFTKLKAVNYKSPPHLISQAQAHTETTENSTPNQLKHERKALPSLQNLSWPATDKMCVFRFEMVLWGVINWDLSPCPPTVAQSVTEEISIHEHHDRHDKIKLIKASLAQEKKTANCAPENRSSHIQLFWGSV